MQKKHQMILSANHQFLVAEIPMDPMLDAIRPKKILTWYDFEQLTTLRHQGRKALARYFLGVLPKRGPKAFPAFLEALQEANAQHLVDFLLQHAGVSDTGQLYQASDGRSTTPTDTPLPPKPDPHEYAVRLTRNANNIRQFVDPALISTVLCQNKVMTNREADMVVHLNGRNRKWDLILAVLLQRGERSFQAFMAALLQHDYSTIFHAIQETSTDLSTSDKDEGSSSEDEAQESDEDIKDDLKKLKEQNNNGSALPNNKETGADETLLARSRDLENAETPQPSGQLSSRGTEDTEYQANNDKSSNGQNGRKSKSSILSSIQEDRGESLLDSQ